jgi:hypothetical protein
LARRDEGQDALKVFPGLLNGRPVLKRFLKLHLHAISRLKNGSLPKLYKTLSACLPLKIESLANLCKLGHFWIEVLYVRGVVGNPNANNRIGSAAAREKKDARGG